MDLGSDDVMRQSAWTHSCDDGGVSVNWHGVWNVWSSSVNDGCRCVIVCVDVGDTFCVVCMLKIAVSRSLPYYWGFSSTAGRYNLWLVTVMVATIQTERNTQNEDNAHHHRDGDF